jgi:L-ascorbate metabolism protein UlaG (beta-lactamase superfamily)
MEILFNWIGGATFILAIGDLKIAVDPVLCAKGTIHDYGLFKSERLEQPIYSDNDFKNIDLWLITHEHEDHLDKIGMAKISTTSKTVCNNKVYKFLKELNLKDLSILKWGQTKKINIKGYDITIEAIPAIHGVNPVFAFIAGHVNGYLVNINKGGETKTIYITGDTVYKNRIRKTIDNRAIDLMVPNMGAACEGTWIKTLTLNSKMLNKLICDLNPKIVIPVHYGTFEHYKEPADSILALNDNRIKVVKVGQTIKIE